MKLWSIRREISLVARQSAVASVSTLPIHSCCYGVIKRTSKHKNTFLVRFGGGTLCVLRIEVVGIQTLKMYKGKGNLCRQRLRGTEGAIVLDGSGAPCPHPWIRWGEVALVLSSCWSKTHPDCSNPARCSRIWLQLLFEIFEKSWSQNCAGTGGTTW